MRLTFSIDSALIIPTVFDNTLCNPKSEPNMKIAELRSLSVDELWELHEAVATELTDKITTERTKLEERLQKLSAVEPQGLGAAKTARKELRLRRPYPKVLPKYRNPKNREETWAGRGKQPRWLTAQLKSGKKLDDFLII
jgi:DNA-binding protein H-NS